MGIFPNLLVDPERVATLTVYRAHDCESTTKPGSSWHFLITAVRGPGTPCLTAWADSGKSGRATRERALRLMGIRQARLEPLAWSASGHERTVNGPTAASEEKRIDFSV